MAPGTLARAGLRLDMISVFGTVGQVDAVAMCMKSQFGTRVLQTWRGNGLEHARDGATRPERARHVL